jgi:hypothetical protein
MMRRRTTPTVEEKMKVNDDGVEKPDDVSTLMHTKAR